MERLASVDETKAPASSVATSRLFISLAAAILIFIGLAIALARAKAPWCDEGWFANPSYNLAFHGMMANKRPQSFRPFPEHLPERH